MNDDAIPGFSEETPRLTHDKLLRVARYHRWVIAVALTQVALWVGYLLLTAARGQSVSDGLAFPTILTFILGGVGGIFAFLLYWTIRGPLPAVIMGLGAVPPCIGVLVLVVVNGTATTSLKAHGVEVGLLGADFDTIPDDIDEYDIDDEGW